MPETDTPRPTIDDFDKVIINKKAYYEKKDIEAVIHIGYRTIDNFIGKNDLEEHEHIRARAALITFSAIIPINFCATIMLSA